MLSQLVDDFRSQNQIRQPAAPFCLRHHARRGSAQDAGRGQLRQRNAGDLDLSAEDSWKPTTSTSMRKLDIHNKTATRTVRDPKKIIKIPNLA